MLSYKILESKEMIGAYFGDLSQSKKVSEI